jgi:DNA-binding response OmpR family regulator
MRVLLCGLGSILTNALDCRLRKYGCKIQRASDTTEALSIIHGGYADILVTSVNTEGYRLGNFIGLIKEDLMSDMPIILVTEPDGDMNAVLEGIEAGADDFVTFPFKPSELILRIELLLHRYVHH